ncbi:threonylcarbamoyl-AMP synthase [Spirochaetia bacterium]|nr:threonylcarbamoyl-AMP synthase [Spirochaetia bacterium]GHU34014.1 threonylcarbamoyl-AMP synthase [Spirochaetia bacterium]
MLDLMVHEYVVPGNPDDRIMRRGAQMLSEGALVALPTDTSWALACSFSSAAGVKKLGRISGEREGRYFTLLCTAITRISELCSLDNTRYRLIKRLIPGPYVFILKTLSGAEKALGLRRPELGIRIPDHKVPLRLMEALNQPLYTITAKREMISGKKPEQHDSLGIIEEDLFEGGEELEGIPGIDMILDPGEDQERRFSTVLDITGPDVLLLRPGAGPWPV